MKGGKDAQAASCPLNAKQWHLGSGAQVLGVVGEVGPHGEFVLSMEGGVSSAFL